MQKSLKSLLAAALAVVVAFPAWAATPDAVSTASQVQIVEFYNATLDHYFITADPQEISDLDTGVHAGWVRTGYAFQGVKAGVNLTGSTPICRFYGLPQAGLDSHFYSATPTECQAVQAKFVGQWELESTEVFRAYPVDPNTGLCPSNTEAIYRLYNNRADVDHRYTDQTTIFQAMVAKGYIPEGNGNPQLPVAFCMPIGTSSTPVPPAAGSPACTLSASTSTPAVGSFVALTTVCTGAPTSYSWVGCTSTTGTCQATSTAAGAATYSVTASNGAGAGAPASVTLTWQGSGGASGPVPVCTLSGTTVTPAVGSTLSLVANCSQSPTTYNWMLCDYMIQSACNLIATCSSTSPSCSVTNNTAGFAHYALQASNGAGLGARVGFDAEWQGSGGTTTPQAPLCSLTASSTSPMVGDSVVLSASCSGSPTSYAWTGCTSSSSSCATSSSTAGAKAFTVVASNAIGSSAPAAATITWQTLPVPSCSVQVSNSTPTVGATVTLTAKCSNGPTSWQWTNCNSTSSTCSATASSAGAASYSVIASSSAGPSPSANATVNWQPAPTSAPACTISASNSSPFTGSAITLTASCNNGPTSYNWTGCSSTNSTCVATSNSAGSVTYGVSATNIIGTGAVANTSVTWQQSTASPDFCSAYSGVQRITMPWGSGPLTPGSYGGSFLANEVLVVGFTIPSNAASFTSTFFSANVAEYQGSPTFRDARLSASPCDFARPLDPTGQNGPISIGTNGTNVTVSGTVNYNLLPGKTYYISIRNWSAASGNTCKTSTCNLIIGQFSWPG